MRYFPAFMDWRGREVWIVGGGELAARKARLVLRAGARVTFWGAGEGASVRAEFGERCAYRARPLGVLRPRPAALIAATGGPDDARAAAIARVAGVPVNVVDAPDLCDFVVPSLVERGDLVVGISTGGAAPVIGRRLRERIEGLLDPRLGRLIAWAGAKRAAVAESVPASRRRAFWERLLAGPAGEAAMAGDEATANRGFDEAVSEGRPAIGHVSIVGAGPGDPDLLTLKAARLLAEADVVFHDALVGEGVMDLVRRDAERVYVGKRRAEHAVPQGEIGERMVAAARAGLRVVRLKGGDPYVFGRGGEEVDAMRAAGVPVTVVPGVTAALGCGASAGVPVTHRGLSQAVTFVTAQGAPGRPEVSGVDWDALARLGHTVAVYMGVALAGRVAERLIAGGRAPGTPVAVIENGTLPGERVVRGTLGTLADDVAAAGLTGPAVLMIGEVAARASSPVGEVPPQGAEGARDSEAFGADDMPPQSAARTAPPWGEQGARRIAS